MQEKGLTAKLPPFAYWTLDDWKATGDEYREIMDNQMEGGLFFTIVQICDDHFFASFAAVAWLECNRGISIACLPTLSSIRFWRQRDT